MNLRNTLRLCWVCRCPGAQHCGEAWQCFHCHEIEKLEGKGFLRACFSKTWKQWKACMQVRKVNAQERLLAGLSLPFLRDVVGLREWCDVSCLDEMLLDGADPEISEEMPAQEPAGEDAEDQGILFPSASTPSPLSSTYHLMWCLGKVFKGKHGRYVDLPRIHERICWSLGIPCGFHYTQLTPLEHMSHVQLQWLERFRLHHEARQLSSSQRRAERFAYMTKEEEGEDVEEYWIQHMLF